MQALNQFTTPQSLQLYRAGIKIHPYAETYTMPRRSKDQEKLNFLEYQNTSAEDMAKIYLGVWDVEE